MSYKAIDIECLNCNFEFEAIISKGLNNEVCPTCGGTNLQQKLNFAGYKIKGVNTGSTKSKLSGSFRKING